MTLKPGTLLWSECVEGLKLFSESNEMDVVWWVRGKPLVFLKMIQTNINIFHMKPIFSFMKTSYVN